jgi:serine/threonine protein kinase
MSDRTIGPVIDGLTFVEHLGFGGYSDVYLYEQRKPRMRVAVKVLTAERLSDSELAQFAGEAETMAELADHPYIVQVFTTGTTDDGRPYLVMKYYPPPNLGKRAAGERFSVAEVLRTGIQISSAVETAHRAGILHRDIKPANILIGQYGDPGLADFGIAGKTADADIDDDLGVSIPWSPPEVLSGASNGSVASDVYSLAATLWNLLAGRSPQEVPGGDNSPRALMGRILRSAPPATGRADAPASLERLLQQAMSKHPAQRPPSALQFARSLQGVEQELRYARTAIVVGNDEVVPRDTGPVPEPGAPATPADSARFSPKSSVPTGRAAAEHPATTVRPIRASQPPPAVQPVQAAGPAHTGPQFQTPAARVGPPGQDSPATTIRPARPTGSPAPPDRFSAPDQQPQSPQPQPDGTRRRPGAAKNYESKHGDARQRHGLAGADAEPATTARPVVAGDGVVETGPEGNRRQGINRKWVGLTAAAVVIIAAVVGTIVLSGGSKSPSSGTSPDQPIASHAGNLGGGPATALPPTFATSVYNGTKHTITFSWSAPAVGGKPARFVYAVGTGALVGPTAQTTVTVPATDPGSACIRVGTVDTNGSIEYATKCGE